MINYTNRLDQALRKAALVHEQQKQHRKGSDTPYIVHPFAVMLIVSDQTEDEDVLIACLLHDVLEDVNRKIYNEEEMRMDFGERVVAIVKDLTKDESKKNWRKRSEAYLHHLKFKASEEAMLISAADKLHNLQTILIDYDTQGEKLWERFTTKSYVDQRWWYKSILAIARKRNVAPSIINGLSEQVKEMEIIGLLAKYPSPKYPELDMNNPYDRDDYSMSVAIQTIKKVNLEKEAETNQHKLVSEFKNFLKR